MAEEPEIEVERPESTTTADVALAAALDEARGVDDLKPKVAAFFEAQTRLADDQRHHMAAQFLVELGVKKLELWSKRLKLLLQSVTTAAAFAIFALVGLMAWRAHGDHSLTLAGFEITPDLSGQGINGRALSSELVDKLRRMQSEVATPQQGAQVRASEGQEIKLEVPETGVSLGEVQHLLNDLFGHQIPLSGALSRVHGGSQDGALALMVRVGDEPGRRLVQPDGDLDALLQKAAEQVDEDLEPARFITWLDQNGRTPEAVDLARRLAQRGRPRQRSNAYLYIGANTPSAAEAERFNAIALDLDPGNFVALNGAALQMPLSEAKLSLFRRAIAAAINDRVADSRADILIVQGNLDAALSQYSDALAPHCFRYGLNTCSPARLTDRALSVAAEADATDTRSGIRLPALTGRITQSHDLADAARLVSAPRGAAPIGRSEAYRAELEAYWLWADYCYAMERRDWPRALALAQAFADLRARWAGHLGLASFFETATPLAHLGRFAEAEVAAAALGDCYQCLITRGRVAELKSDHAAADRWFAQAARQGPSLPQAEDAWGESLLARGDADGAIVKLKAAVKKAPHFADPIEAWGEALMGKGDFSGAAGRFAEAVKYAPNWGRLHWKWAQALAKAGKTDEARAQKQAAATLDLTPAERAELDGLRI